MKNSFRKSVVGVLALSALLLASQPAAAQTVNGVSKNEVLIGSLMDLSGPLSGFSKQVINGIRMRFDEVNATGGVAGRKLKLIVEDTGYDTKKAMMGAQKLVQSDRIFLTLANQGTAITATTLPIFLEAGVIHAFPFSATPVAFDPPSPLKFAFAVPYSENGKVMVRYMAKTRADRKYCTLVQDDDFGQDLMIGINAEVAAQKLTLIEKTSYKRGATDFSSQVARLKTGGCDTVFLATVARETVGVISEARKIGYNPDFVASSAAFTMQIPKLGGEAMDGLMVVGLNYPPEPNGPTPGMKKWFAAFKAKYAEEPDQFASMGYDSADWIVKGIEGAGADLTAARFNDAMERTPFPADEFGFAPMTFSKTKRLGGTAMRIYRLQGGRWVAISEFI